MRCAAVVALALLSPLGGCAPEARVSQQRQARLGINLSGPTDWNTELPFVDVFRLSRAWISQREGEPWGMGPKLEIDERGWVKRLEPGCYAETPLCTIEGGHYPSGQYVVLYEGSGELEFWGAARAGAKRPGRILLDVDSKKGGFFLRLKATDPRNPVRNIRVVMPGFERTYLENPFHPTFLQRWKGVSCIRFMDWMLTNDSTQSTWNNRPRSDEATYTTKGVPVETMVDLCNRLKADAWFCMPHQADDEYVREFAKLVKARLDPSLKVYVEYSNEVWNGQFGQNRYAAEQGQKRGFADKPWEAAWRYTAFRSVQVFGIWEEAFGRSRLVRVLPSQAANPYVSEQILAFRDAYRRADALAIAPYVGITPSPEGKPSLAEAETWTADQALDYLEKTSLPEAIEMIAAQKKVADRFGLKLVAYEGGQHMVGTMGAENSERLTKTFLEANAHPRIEGIYAKYLKGWTESGGGLFCHFSSVGEWSKWGSWGLLRTYDEPPARSPKFRAAMQWAREMGQGVSVPR